MRRVDNPWAAYDAWEARVGVNPQPGPIDAPTPHLAGLGVRVDPLCPPGYAYVYDEEHLTFFRLF